MRPLFLSAGLTASLATLGAVALAQTPRPAAPPSVAPSSTVPPGPLPSPPASAPAGAPAAQGSTPSSPAGTAPPASPAPSAPLPPRPSSAPTLETPPPGPPPPGPPPGAQPAVYGPPPGGQPPYPAPPYYPIPVPYLAQAPPAVPLDAHSHTGFFLRMALGGGYMSTATTLEGPSFPGKVDAGGGAAAIELAIGGALSPGIILAGSYSVLTVGNAKLTNDSRTYRPEHDMGLTLLAAMLDVYPNPKAGFHFGGALGFASVKARADEDGQASSAGQNGFGIAPLVGYEWWVGNYWGLGVLGRFVYARTQGDYADGKEKDSVVGAAVLFSATYN